VTTVLRFAAVGESAPDRVARGIAHWAEVRPEVDTSGTEVVGRVIWLGARCQEAIARSLSAHGLGLGDYSALAILRSQGGSDHELSPSALARATFVTTGGMANLLKRLEARGLVARRADPADGRGVLVRLTDAGRERIDAAAPGVGRTERELVRSLSARERAALARGLSRLMAGLDT
jgi:DNA-binding MarR family transcriptional regulator